MVTAIPGFRCYRFSVSARFRKAIGATSPPAPAGRLGEPSLPSNGPDCYFNRFASAMASSWLRGPLRSLSVDQPASFHASDQVVAFASAK